MPIIFRTKLYIPPPRVKAVARQRLYQKLSESLTRPLTLISAPAGFGKSTLVSSWYEQSRGAFHLAWVSLDSEDNEPERFLAYLAAASGQLQAGLGEGLLAALDTPQPVEPRAALRLLIRDLAEFAGTGVLVLDDYHTITNSEIHDLLSYLIGNLPPDLHLIIATRADPPLQLSRLRVNDRLVEIRAADMLFRQEEVEDFLAQTMGLTLSREASARLAKRTEGWAAGLQLAALAARSDGGQVLEAGFGGDHPYLLDYLLEEVLTHLPREQQAFLLRTSLLEELCGPLCDAVLAGDSLAGGQNSAQILDALYRANLFLIPLGSDASGRQWFRYHHLFAEALLARLKQMDGALISTLYSRAARWYACEDRMEGAIRCALAGGEIEQAVGWIEAAAPEYLNNGRAWPVRRWIQSLSSISPTSADRLRSRPRLAIAWARTLYMTGDFAQTRIELDRLEQLLLQEHDAESRAMLGMVYSMRGTITSIRGDWARTIADAERGLELLPESDANWRSVAALNLGNAQLVSGNYQAGDDAFNSAIREGLQAGNLHVVFTAIANQGETLLIRGLLQEGIVLLKQGLRIIDERELSRSEMAPTASLVYCNLGELCIECFDLPAAETYIQKSLEMTEEGGFVIAVISALAAQAHLELARGTPEKGLPWIERAINAVQGPHAHGLHAQLIVRRERLHLAMGDLASVERWAESVELDPDAEIDFLYEVEAIMMMRLYLARGQAHRGLELGQRILAAAEAGQRLGRAQEIRLQMSLLHHQLGNHPAALAALRQALAFAVPRGYCGMFVESGSAMRLLLRSLLRGLSADDPLRAGARRILEVLPPGGDDGEIAGPQLAANQLLIEPLSERELEVLRMVAQGASNQQVADHLIVSLGTVKSHVHHIQGKLGSSSRVELVRRARDLGLV